MFLRYEDYWSVLTSSSTFTQGKLQVWLEATDSRTRNTEVLGRGTEAKGTSVETRNWRGPKANWEAGKREKKTNR